MKRIYLLFFSLTISLFALTAQASENQKTNAANDEEFDPTAVIMHHISDAHDWHLWDKVDKETGEKRGVSIPLPVIVWYNGQLDVFMSSAFHHGEQTVIKGANEYALYHNKIYVAENGAINFDENHHPTNPQPLDFSITKNVASMMFSALLLLAVFIPMGRKYKKGGKVPSGLQGFMEPIILFIKEDIAQPNIGEHKYQRFLPYLITVFFFIWFNNMLGLIPFFPGGANLTGNIAVTFTLAAITMIITNVSGNKSYWKHVFATPGVPVWLAPIMIPVELIGILSKPFALMIRLFANITAGHIIVLSLISLIFIFKTIWIAPVSIAFVLFMDVLELLVALLQAYIFTLLSALFIGLAVQEHH
ncbi:MAG: ATP synthase F0 subunit A [Bacteroidetes bacterium HGW-Bacteroidetes-4]|jgi:F-type H+-transporting ATPase subunit a|nr:MAG: ATP synthase F0 subunit A [Bacteroidetes bacterium HGW-Bacteroidetes-4]